MNARSRANNRGLSLVETVIAVLVIGVAATGGLAYQYHAAKHLRAGKVQMTAARMAQLLLEDWQRSGGSGDYDPRRLRMGLSRSAGGYVVTAGGVEMNVALSRSAATDAQSGTLSALVQISVTVGWRGDFGPIADYTVGQGPCVMLSTYVQSDM